MLLTENTSSTQATVHDGEYAYTETLHGTHTSACMQYSYAMYYNGHSWTCVNTHISPGNLILRFASKESKLLPDRVGVCVKVHTSGLWGLFRADSGLRCAAGMDAPAAQEDRAAVLEMF